MIYLDANVFIDFIEGKLDWANPLKTFFDVLSNNHGRAFTSELTLAEVLAPTKLRGPLPPDIRRLYLDVIVWNAAISLAPVSREILYDTAELRRYTGHKLPDAIHVATAMHAKCNFFVSRDTDARKLPRGIELVIPDQSGLSHLIGAIHAR